MNTVSGFILDTVNTVNDSLDTVNTVSGLISDTVNTVNGLIRHSEHSGWTHQTQ